MNKQEIRRKAAEVYADTPGNIMPVSGDVDPVCRGLRLFDEPLVGFGDAADPLFEQFKNFSAIGPWHRTPAEWMPGAKTVISFFFPISEAIRKANRAETDHGSLQWAYARVDGQRYMDAFLENFRDWLLSEGVDAFVPSLSEEFDSWRAGVARKTYRREGMDDNTYGSNWSERHAAYVCGLGTFSLTRGLITERGMAGRFASVLAECRLDPDPRPYSGLYDYCIRCGKCVSRCPEHALSLEFGKDQKKCSVYSKKSKALFYPRFGCGLCQTGVPCEDKNPSAGHPVRTGGWENINVIKRQHEKG